MLCPKCNFSQPDGSPECASCGVIFAKIKQAAHLPAGPEQPHSAVYPAMEQGGDRFLAKLRPFLRAIGPEENRLVLASRAIAYLILLGWGVKFIATPLASDYFGQSFLHLIHLPFHEAGHIIFMPFGRFICVLGGTLGQLLIPSICIGAFLKYRNPFAASVGLWWLAESFMDVAPYANDARAGELMLLGGVTGSEVEDYHDWEVMLGKLGWLPYDHAIARVFSVIGVTLMLLALVWGGYILYRQARKGS